MKLTIDLSDRQAIRETYGDCQKWRGKGGVLRGAVSPESKPYDPTLLLPQRPWHTVLELGCGLEQWIKGLIANAAPDGTIYACDFNEDILRIFSKEFKEYNNTWSEGRLRHYCILGDGEKLPFMSRGFDGISALFVGHHMHDAETFVGGLARALKPDGWLLTNSLDWSSPPPDFPSLGLQKLLGEPSRFFVRNAFDETSARRSLNRHFAEIREHKVIISATLRSVEELIKLHSRQEYFIKRVLPPNYQWDDYLSCVEEIVREYIDQNGFYRIELPITYFIAEHPHART
jgi:SAM-dependent methyltransferase